MAAADIRRGRLGRLLFAAALGAAMLLALPARARPGVVVAEFSDATGRNRGEKARTAIVKALAEADGLDLVPYAKVKTVAASHRVKTADLAKPKVLARMVLAAGADAAVVGIIGRDLKIAIHIYDASGEEIWQKTVPLANGELSAATAQRFAAAIGAAVGARPGERSTRTTPEPDLDQPPPATDVPRAPVEASARPEDETLAAVPEPARKPRENPGGPSSDVEPQPEPKKSDEEDLARPGWLELSVDPLSFVWRTYQFCPEVSDCGQTPANPGSAVNYSTKQPYWNLFLRADVYPLRFLNNFVRGLGVSATFGRSFFLQTHYFDDGGVDQSFGSTEQTIAAELVYRFYYRIDSMGDGWIGLRGGFLSHSFFVDATTASGAAQTKIVQSVRSGFYGQIDASLPLQKFLRVEARAALVPLANPGSTEQATYGSGDPADGLPTQGGGWWMEAGLTSDLGHPAWHIGIEAMFQYMHYGDRYYRSPDQDPTVVTSEFGRALEDYFGFRIGVRTHI